MTSWITSAIFAKLTPLPKSANSYALLCFSMGQRTPKITHSREGILSPSNTWFLWPIWVTHTHKHFDWFSSVCKAHKRDQQTHRQADHATPSAAIVHVHRNAHRGFQLHKRSMSSETECKSTTQHSYCVLQNSCFTQYTHVIITS